MALTLHIVATFLILTFVSMGCGLKQIAVNERTDKPPYKSTQSNSSNSSNTPNPSQNEDDPCLSDCANTEDPSPSHTPSLTDIDSPMVYGENTAIFPLTFTNAGAEVISCSISPELPQGLSIQVKSGSCQIVGTALETRSATLYTVTATSQEEQSDTATVTIIVRVEGIEVANLAGTPSDPSNQTTLSITVSGTDVTAYRYKIGPLASTNCSQEAFYSDPILVDNQITDDIAALSDAALRLCVIGRDSEDYWQSLSEATSYSWTKDTTPPSAFNITLPGTYAPVSTPSIEWDEAEDAATYDVAISTVADCASNIVSSQNGVNNTSWTSNPLGDGSYFICVTASDSLGNTRSATNNSKAFTVDTQPPGDFSITAPDALVSTSEPTVSWAASQDAVSYTLHIDSDDDCEAPFVQNHSGLTTTSHKLNALSDGSYHICVVASDAAGHITSADNAGTYTFIVDASAPTINVQTFTEPQSPGDTVVRWSMTETHATSLSTATIEISNDGNNWTTLETPALGVDGPLTNYIFDTNITLPEVDTPSARIRVRYTDTAGNEGQGTSDLFIIDKQNPIVTSITINDGEAPPALSNYLRISLEAEDAGPSGSMISHLCLKYLNNTKPSANDTCWIGVTPANPLQIQDFYFRVGFNPQTYTIYAFVKDQSGNISSLSSGGVGTNGVDMESIYVRPGTPPRVSRVSATSTQAPNSPPDMNDDLMIPQNQTVYIKWKVEDDEGLTPAPIKLSYTLNGTDFLPIADNLINGSNNGCVVDHLGTTWDDEATGCYIWSNGSPTNNFYRIRVTATDLDNMITFGQSDALNLEDMRFLAGNTEPGLGGSARSATFQISARDMQAQKLAVHPSGKIFVLDDRGLMMINPTDGIQQLIIPQTGTISGDGGPVSNASLGNPYRIAITYQGNLLISDHNRIRIIDINALPMTIRTLIGGGAQTGDGIPATSLSMSATRFAHAPLIPLPNGDVLFQSSLYYVGVGGQIRRYIAATETITTIPVSGPTTLFKGTVPVELSACLMRSFAVGVDTVTSTFRDILLQIAPPDSSTDCVYVTNNGVPSHYGDIISLDPDDFSPSDPLLTPLFHISYKWPYFYEFVNGLDGEIYAFSPFGTTANEHARIVHYDRVEKDWVTIAGSNAIGECLDGVNATSCNLRLQSVFVDANSKVYFIDDGIIRTITDEGKILTLAGQRLSFGDGGLAQDARFNTITSMQKWNDGTHDRLVIGDEISLRVREVVIGGEIIAIAGDGNYKHPDLVTPANEQGLSFGQHVRSSNLVLDDEGNIFTNRHQSYIGKISRDTGLWTSYTTNPSGYGPNILARSDTKFLIGNHGYFQVAPGPGSGNGTLFEWDIATGVSTTILAKPGNHLSAPFCDNGVSLMDCGARLLASPSHVSFGGWDPYANRWYLKEQNHNRIVKFAAGGNMEELVTLPRNANAFAYRRAANLAEMNTVYYCGQDGIMYQYNINTEVETAFTYPIPGMQCPARGQVLYDSSRSSVIFNYTFNGLEGVAEFLLP